MQELVFQSQTIRAFERDGKIWASAADIAKCLGYASADKVTHLYLRHAAEFTESMTRVVQAETADAQNGRLLNKTSARVFSLRGAHLIGMLARTKKACEFRVWVLNILEKQEADNKSLVQEFYEAQAKLEAQERFASMCGKGLSEHKKQKPPLVETVKAVLSKMQGTLPLNLA